MLNSLEHKAWETNAILICCSGNKEWNEQKIAHGTALKGSTPDPEKAPRNVLEESCSRKPAHKGHSKFVGNTNRFTIRNIRMDN